MSGITTDSTPSESTFFSPFLYIVKGLYLGQVSSQVSGVVLLSLVCLWDTLVGQKHSITRGAPSAFV